MWCTTCSRNEVRVGATCDTCRAYKKRTGKDRPPAVLEAQRLRDRLSR